MCEDIMFTKEFSDVTDFLHLPLLAQLNVN